MGPRAKAYCISAIFSQWVWCRLASYLYGNNVFASADKTHNQTQYMCVFLSPNLEWTTCSSYILVCDFQTCAAPYIQAQDSIYLQAHCLPGALFLNRYRLLISVPYPSASDDHFVYVRGETLIKIVMGRYSTPELVLEGLLKLSYSGLKCSQSWEFWSGFELVSYTRHYTDYYYEMLSVNINIPGSQSKLILNASNLNCLSNDLNLN